MTGDKHYALSREAILEALTAWSGITTADGATPGNNTLIDSNLIGKNDFLSGKAILIGSGVDAAYEDKGVESFDNVTGEIIVSAGFSAQIKQGTPFRVLNVSSGGVVSTLLNDIKTKTENLAGEDPVSDSVTANWNTATGTSGESGEDLVVIGAAGVRHKLHSLLLDVSALTDGAKIRVKLFMKVNGVEKKIYDQEFTVPTGTTPPNTDGLWVVNGTVAIHDTLRVEVYSDTSESKAITYTYMLEAM